MLKNYMEIMVERVLPQLLAEYNTCKCQRCIEDIKARSLNNLKPLYVVSEKGQVYMKLNEMQGQFNTDVITELVESIEKVASEPHH